VIMNQAKIEQIGTPQEVYDRPATPFVYQFLGNVNVLRSAALAGSRAPMPATGLQKNGHVYVRPHDIEIVPHAAGVHGIVAVVRYIHAAGPQARLTLEQVETRELVEAEISRAELGRLELQVNSLVLLRLRQSHTFAEDYAI